MSRIGLDAHVLTGKPQGSKTWLRSILREIDVMRPSEEYVVLSHDPDRVATMVGHSSLQHEELARHRAPVRLLRDLPRAVRTLGLDALVTQYNAPPFASGKQVVVVHDILFETHPDFFPTAMRRRLQMLTRLSVTSAALVVTVSEYSRRQIESRYGVDEARMVVCRNAASTVTERDDRAAQWAADQGPYLLMVGRLEPRKNVDLVVRSTESLRKRGVTLVVVGQADFSARGTMAAMSAADNVVHLTGVSDVELAELYRGAGALVFASSGEGFGLPVLEALVYGAPVIATDRTSVPEVGGEFAAYFNPDSSDAEQALAALAEQVLEQPPTWDQRAIQAHLDTFRWSRSASAFVQAVSAIG